MHSKITLSLLLSTLIACQPQNPISSSSAPVSVASASNNVEQNTNLASDTIRSSDADSIILTPTEQPKERIDQAKNLQKQLQQFAIDNQNRPKANNSDDAETIRKMAQDDMKLFREQTAQLKAQTFSDSEVAKVRDMIVESRTLSADALDSILAESDEKKRYLKMTNESPEAKKMAQGTKLEAQALNRLIQILNFKQD